ncbi:ArpU family transcriptional regulator [Enterococcus sp. 669A]|uniref:ArpU family transcriptional regulator n=1 Tax=Candidatus Enterococcus moelleringii TaxID=2815325 RepID=A0ABS3LBZ1_9ENTE|nr:ArpU family transcriptional regulator [Enterococcus sp. 669A]MBO1306543.1 ArpU family transcriptional regulator [Enterococcus sp. 669A]
MGFDIAEFLCPEIKDVDIRSTKKNVGIFLSAYLAYRQRVGQPREPKVTASLSLTPISSNQVSKQAEEILIYNEEIKEKFLELHEQFVLGFSAIEHPFKPEISKRKKKIFYDRYILGYSVYVTAERNHVSEDLVSQESTKCIVQFAHAIGMIIAKK